MGNTYTGIRAAARPEIQGDAMREPRGGKGYRWKRGPLEVEIDESEDFDHRGRLDWRVIVAVFGHVVAEDWKRTPVEAASWADRKLGQVERALIAPRAAGRSER